MCFNEILYILKTDLHCNTEFYMFYMSNVAIFDDFYKYVLYTFPFVFHNFCNFAFVLYDFFILYYCTFSFAMYAFYFICTIFICIT